MNKRKLTTALARYGANPVVRRLLELGVPVPGTALLETIGRRSGKPRRTPVTYGLLGDSFWIVAEHGRRAAYVRNIEAHPRVRVKVGRRWWPGTAHLALDDDPRRRLRTIAASLPWSRLAVATVGLMHTELLSIRIDLEP